MEPIKLKVKNFYALADGEIDFTTFMTALIIGYYDENQLKSNGSGKSSIFEALCWVLFNETRQTKVDDVIRWSENEAIVDFEFLFANKLYKITRRRSRIAKESSVSFYTKEGETWINDSGSTNSETNKKILSLIKIDSKIFLNSVYFKQQDISLFANSSPSDRKDIIKSIMKIERWDEYQKQAKNKLKEVKDELEEQNRVITDNANLSVTSIINFKSIEVANKRIEEITREQKAVVTGLHALIELKKERNINTLLTELDSVSKQLGEIKINGKKAQTKRLEFNDTIDANKLKIRSLQQQISSTEANVADIEGQISSLKKESLLYHDLEEPIVAQRVEKSKLENTVKEIQDTSSMVGLGQCQVCLSDITEGNLPHIHQNRKSKLGEASKRLVVVTEALAKLDIEYKKRLSNKSKFDKLHSELETKRVSISKMENQKQSLDIETSNSETELARLDTYLANAIEKVKSLKAYAEDLEKKIAEQKANNIDNQIGAVEEQNRILLEALQNENIKLGALLKDKENLKERQDLVETANEHISKLLKRRVACEQLTRYLGRDGIQAVLIETVIDELEACANEMLQSICNEPTVIRLKTQKKTGDSWQETLEIDVVMNGIQQTFESLGGGEKFRISLALRIGLSEILAKRAGGEIKFLLLDEVDSPLDQYGLNNLFENIIKGLQKRFKIVIITHNDTLKQRFEDLIIVNKTANGSFVTQSRNVL